MWISKNNPHSYSQYSQGKKKPISYPQKNGSSPHSIHSKSDSKIKEINTIIALLFSFQVQVMFFVN